ncbi:MAG: FAD-dependent thymidylate synthase [Patescibacteria group bacterium]
METKSNQLSVYTLDNLKPEVVAVAFAKCSRSPESFRDIADELTDEKSADFHEKWVVGYGHGSVAEHANLHLAIENISILATKTIEDNRLCSYTEKSTRYQVFDKTKYYKPKKIMESPLGAEYEKTMDEIFDVYSSLNAPMKEFILKKYPRQPEENEKIYNATIKARVCDNVRYILPTATLTNLGMTANARALEHAIAKLLSHPLIEMNEIGEAIKKSAMEITPTLIKYAEKNKYIQETDEVLKKLNDNLTQQYTDAVSPVEIVDYDKDAEDKLATALLYKNSDLPYKQIMSAVKLMNGEQKEKIIDEAIARRGKGDQPPREFEHIYYTFDILMDYGAFRDIQRHRMCTQTNQKITIKHGFEIPEEIIEVGLEEIFKQTMKKAESLYKKIHIVFPEEAQYILPLAFRKRTLITWNLRELHHFISLRSGPKGHISYRRIAQACWKKLNEIHPLLAKHINVNMTGGSDSWASTLYNPKYNYKPSK